MSVLAVAMLMTAAGDVQRQQTPRTPPPLVVAPAPIPNVMRPPPMPAPPAPYVPPMMAPPRPPPAPPSPRRLASPPVVIRAPQTCWPSAYEGNYDFSGCFNGGDYPLAAYAAREEGVARVRVQLGANGRPTACEVAVSSGSAALNRATCDLLRRRILGAENDEGGRVTSASISGEVRWLLPAGPPRDDRPDLLTYFSVDDYPSAALRSDEQGTVGARVDIDATGRVTTCTVTGSSGSASLDSTTCRIMRSRVRYRPARDASGRPVRGTATLRVMWRLPPE